MIDRLGPIEKERREVLMTISEKLSGIEGLVRVSTDKNKFNSGLALYKTQGVRDAYAKIEENMAVCYGMVIDEYHRQNYSCMMSLDLGYKSIVDWSCDCQSLLTQSANMNPQICGHVVATALKGLELLKDPDSQVPEMEGVMVRPNLHVGMASGRNGFMKMNFKIEGINPKDYRKVYNAYKEGNRGYLLKDGNYLDLSDEKLSKTLQLIDLLGVYNEMEAIKIPETKALYLDELLEDGFDFIDGRKYVTNVINKLNKSQAATFEVPSHLKKVLRPYQIEGFEFLNTLDGYAFGGLLADDMGLGKTLQIITFLLAHQGAKSLIITPTALVYNWKSELERFAPTLKVGVLHGNKAVREKVFAERKQYDVLLTTYTTFKNDEASYRIVPFDYCIIDEAQMIKNPDAKITEAIKKVQAGVRFALTGTPIENNLLELWSIFDFIMPGYLYSRLRFQNIFINDPKNRSALKQLIKPFLLRRTKKEVLTELPDKIEQKIVVPLEGEHQRVYKGYLKLIKRKISETGQNPMALFSYLTKLRQLSLAPEIMIKNYEGKSSKLEVLINLIEEAGEQKILVFSQFTTVLGQISKRLEKEGISYSYLDGKISSKERIARVDAFNQDETIKVFLISLKAGGTGLNLTSASMVIHFDPWWNPAAQNQASDRAYRMGQKNAVNIIHLIAKGTVEERVLYLQESKKELIEEMLSGEMDDSHVLKNLSQEELMALLLEE